MASSNEAFYDAEIAPKLAELANACKARGMSFVASVEYEHDETGETYSVGPDCGIKMLMARLGIACRGNVDAFMLQVERHAREHGHSSMYLTLRGIPTTPPSREEHLSKEKQ